MPETPLSNTLPIEPVTIQTRPALRSYAPYGLVLLAISQLLTAAGISIPVERLDITINTLIDLIGVLLTAIGWLRDRSRLIKGWWK